MKAVEPSEILIDRHGLPREDTTRFTPWIRFLARFFDYSLLLLLLRVARTLGWPSQSISSFVPIEFFMWIPIETLLLCTWGKTPGKFFLKLQLKQGRKARLDFYTAIRRSFLVWFRGLGMGIPIVVIFCLLVAYHRFTTLHRTSWDWEDNIAVIHRPVGRWRLVASALVAITGFALYYYRRLQ